MGSFPDLLFKLVLLGLNGTDPDDIEKVGNYNKSKNDRDPENPCVVPGFSNCKFIFFKVSPYVIFPLCFIDKLIFSGRKVYRKK